MIKLKKILHRFTKRTVFKKIDFYKKYSLLSDERLLVNYEQVRNVVINNVPGVIVECGVWKGGSAMMMIQALIDSNEFGRDVYLYDTYAGMSEPSIHDKKNKSEVLAAEKWEKLKTESHNEWCYASIDEVKNNVQSLNFPKEKIHFIEGKVEDTIPNTIPDSIAILRLDTDWYESTKHELTYLYPRLSRGGVLILDDYGSWDGARKAVDEYFIANKIEPNLQFIDGTGRFHIKK